MKKSVLLTIIAILVATSFAFGQTTKQKADVKYSIKGRWNVKMSYSLYRTPYWSSPWLFEIDYVRDGIVQRKNSNFRFEGSYGVVNWLEMGVYAGWQNYRICHPEDAEAFGVKKLYWAPTFGLSAKIHLLPFFVKDQNCRWEWYIKLNYGGCYLSKPYEIALPNGFEITDDYLVKSQKKYRHEYALGMGGGVYFWNLFGLFAEASVGQFSYWPEIFFFPINFRAGVAFKF